MTVTEGTENRMILRTVAAFSIFLGALAGCTTPSQLADTSRWSLGYRVDVQQGNVITQEMLAQLQPGMEKKKVTFIMGAPIIQDTFHKDRWDYIYTLQKGRHQAKRRHVTLVFEDDKLKQVVGDVVPASGPIAVNLRKEETIEVPAAPKRNVVYRTMNAIPFIGDKPRKAKAAKPDEDDALIVRQAVAVPESPPGSDSDSISADAAPPDAPATGKPPAGNAKPAAATGAREARAEASAPTKPGFFKRLFTRSKKADDTSAGSTDKDGTNDTSIERPDDGGPDTAPGGGE